MSVWHQNGTFVRILGCPTCGYSETVWTDFTWGDECPRCRKKETTLTNVGEWMIVPHGCLFVWQEEPARRSRHE